MPVVRTALELSTVVICRILPGRSSPRQTVMRPGIHRSVTDRCRATPPARLPRGGSRPTALGASRAAAPTTPAVEDPTCALGESRHAHAWTGALRWGYRHNRAVAEPVPADPGWLAGLSVARRDRSCHPHRRRRSRLRSGAPCALADLDLEPTDVDRLVLTHFHDDHTGGAAEVAGWGGVDVLAPADDAPIIPGEQSGPPPNYSSEQE